MGNELVTPDNIVTTISTFQSTAALINSNEGLTLLLSFLGLSGYSLRDFKGKFNLAKFREKFKKELPEGTKNETQESILSNSLVELQDYIKNNENLDDKVFEKIGNILINGIKTEDILTREYIKILKNLSWIDLSIFMELDSNHSFLSSSHLENYLKAKLNYPLELITSSLNNLKTFNLILAQPENKEILGYDYKNELGTSIFNLLKYN